MSTNFDNQDNSKVPALARHTVVKLRKVGNDCRDMLGGNWKDHIHIIKPWKLIISVGECPKLPTEEKPAHIKVVASLHV